MIKSEPVLFAGLARLLVLAGAYFGLHVDADTLLAAFGAIELVIVPLVRSRVTPVAKVSAGKSTLVSMLFVAVLTLFGCSGCAGSFEEARAPRVTLSASVTDRCAGLDSAHRNWSAAAKGATVLAGASGLSTIPIANRDAQIALAASTAGLAGLAAFAQIESDGFASSWARECSGQ